MKLKLSQSIFEDLESRAVIHDSANIPNPCPIWVRLEQGNWPKNMTFEVTPEDVMSVAYEASWQGWLAVDWADGNEDNWALGQITAAKFQVERCRKLMTPEQLEQFTAWRAKQKGLWS